jgi:hypothetical protein
MIVGLSISIKVRNIIHRHELENCSNFTKFISQEFYSKLVTVYKKKSDSNPYQHYHVDDAVPPNGLPDRSTSRPGTCQ